jgi:chromosomal replication initiation ATPase DnaA
MTRPSAASQIPLDLPFRPAMAAADFLVDRSNADAVAWIDRWPAWPSPTLVVHGPPSSGKTHLVQVWRARSHGPLISGAALTVEEVPDLLGSGWAVAVDDADAVAGHPRRERALLHLYNLVRERGASLLLAARRPASRWGVVLPDLASRLNAANSAGMDRPGDTLLTALLAKLCADRRLAVDDDVLAFLVARMERSADFARRVVTALDRESLAVRRPVTVALARTVMRQLEED